MVHQLEQDKTCASWVLPLCMALQIDCDELKKHNDVKRWFQPETIHDVSDKIEMLPWHGIGRNLVPLKNDIWLVAFMFDPYYTPNNLVYDSILDTKGYSV